MQPGAIASMPQTVNACPCRLVLGDGRKEGDGGRHRSSALHSTVGRSVFLGRNVFQAKTQQSPQVSTAPILTNSHESQRLNNYWKTCSQCTSRKLLADR